MTAVRQLLNDCDQFLFYEPEVLLKSKYNCTTGSLLLSSVIKNDSLTLTNEILSVQKHLLTLWLRFVL